MNLKLKSKSTKPEQLMAEQLLAWLVQVGLFPQALLGPGGRKYVISKTITNCSVWGYEDFWGPSVKGVVAETAKDNLDTATMISYERYWVWQHNSNGRDKKSNMSLKLWISTRPSNATLLVNSNHKYKDEGHLVGGAWGENIGKGPPCWVVVEMITSVASPETMWPL